ncbi:MAG: acetate kinase [Hydrogenophilales bacterium]|nr:acetate kinase [Hydrogenophilales bacterium]
MSSAFIDTVKSCRMWAAPRVLAAFLAKAGLIAATLALPAPAAVAAEAPPDPGELATIKQQLADEARALAAQQRQLAEDMKKLEAHKRALQDSQRRLSLLQKQLGMAPNEPRADDTDLLVSGGQGGGSAPESPPVDVGTLFAQPTILTPKGAVVFEPSLQYSFSNSDRVSIVGYSILPALVIGLIDVRTVSRSTWIAAADVRYGLTSRLELEAKLPYVYRYDDTLSRPLDLNGGATDQLFNASGNGIGDIELAARYQLNLPKGDDPFYIAGLRLKTRTGKDPFDVSYATGSTLTTYGSVQTELPTGSGFYTLQPSLSVVLPADPAVFFGGISYLWNIKRDINKNVGGVQIGQVDPGDGVDINLGMGLALNERSSFSVGYEHTWLGKSTLNGVTPPTELSTQLASLLVGYSYRLNKTTNLNLSIGAGLTNDTPDTQITLRVPIRF